MSENIKRLQEKHIEMAHSTIIRLEEQIEDLEGRINQYKSRMDDYLSIINEKTESLIKLTKENEVLRKKAGWDNG